MGAFVPHNVGKTLPTDRYSNVYTKINTCTFTKNHFSINTCKPLEREKPFFRYVNIFYLQLLTHYEVQKRNGYKGNVFVPGDVCTQVRTRLTDLPVSHADEPLIHQFVSFRVSGLTLHNITLCRLVCQRDCRNLGDGERKSCYFVLQTEILCAWVTEILCLVPEGDFTLDTKLKCV